MSRATVRLRGPGAAYPELDIAAFGLRDADRAEDFAVDGFAWHTTMTLDEVRGALREFYCRAAVFGYLHIQDSRERRWIQQRVEFSPAGHPVKSI